MDKFLVLHLSLIDGVGAGTIQKIIDLKRSDVNASDLYLFSIADFMQVFGMTPNLAQKIVAGLSDKKNLERELSLIAINNVQWVTITEENYPQSLREIYLPPAVLYWFGGTFDDMSRSIAFVGSRKATNYGYRVVNTIVPDLVVSGYTIVSGGALGIDTAAHDASLRCGGKTIAVLGSGLLCLYPSENKLLFRAIIDQRGLLVSAFPLSTEAKPGNFPARNRIITGLSRGCVVVQAAKKSGALISANYAMEQGREVFAVPGAIDDELSVGCNMLIQNGAKLVVSSADILNEFGDRLILPERKTTVQQVQQLFPETTKMDTSSYSPIQQLIINACMQPASFDDIATVTLLTFEQVQAEMFTLQLDGIVSQDFAGMWQTLRMQ